MGPWLRFLGTSSIVSIVHLTKTSSAYCISSYSSRGSRVANQSNETVKSSSQKQCDTKLPRTHYPDLKPQIHCIKSRKYFIESKFLRQISPVMRRLMQPLGRMICLQRQRQRGFPFILSAVSPNARAARLKGTASISWSTLCEGQKKKKVLHEVHYEVPPCRYLWGRGCSQCNLDCSRCWTSRCFLLSQAQSTADGEAAIQTGPDDSI